MRTVSLSALKSGMTRLRVKGAASPESLFELTNGWINAIDMPQIRPGAPVDQLLPPSTVGLCSFHEQLVVFSHQANTMPAGYLCEVIKHPTAQNVPLARIHFAAPFVGFLYVAVEFADGLVRHYWLQRRDVWQASHNYQLGDLVEPTTPNGFLYEAVRIGDPGLLWAPNVVRTVGDVVEPTVPNGFEYHCINTLGSNPRSGTTEPVWPTTEGATVNEDTDLTPPVTPRPGGTDPPDTLPGDTLDRYGRLGDGFGGLRQ